MELRSEHSSRSNHPVDMYTKIIILVLSVVGWTLAYPRTYQEQRQIYYTQPIPVHQRLAAAPQIYVPQQPILQVPASTSLLPNNINSGVRYGQHQIVYVVPSGTQVYYEEQAGAGEGTAGQGTGGGGYVDSVVNFLQGASSLFPFGSGGKPAPGAGSGTGVEGQPEKEEKPEKLEQPEKPEQSGEQSNLVEQQRPNAQYLQQQQQPQQQLQQQFQQLQQQPQPQQQLQQQQLLQKYHTQLQQDSLEKFFALRNQQLYANAPGAAPIGLPSANVLYYKNAQQLSDYNKKKPGAAAIEFQRFLTRKHEGHHQTTTEGSENEEQVTTPEGDTAQAEEQGPSIAQAKPQAVSVAGPGGVAAAAPVGTAIVGPGGMALSAPQATAVAGTKPKPGSNDKIRTYLPRNAAISAFYAY